MDTTTPPTQDNQFIPKKEESGVNALFEELGSELDFWEVTRKNLSGPSGKKHPLEWALLGFGLVFKILLVGTFVSAADVSVRNLNSSEVIKNIPLCSYYAMGLENYGNADCHTYAEIESNLKNKRASLEQKLGVGLAKLVPQKLLVMNVLKSQEVQYILAKTTSSRVSINEMLKKFNDLKNDTTEYKGEDIQCSTYVVNEKWELSVSCDFLGFSITNSPDKAATSRSTAIMFLDKLKTPGSGFRIMNEPKILEMQPYSSLDTKIQFTTKTPLILKLKYASPNPI